MKKILALIATFTIAFTMLIASPAQAANLPAVKGEPKCTGILIWKNCEARDLYRFVAEKTKKNDVTSIKASLLMVATAMGQSAKANKQVAAKVESNILAVTPIIQSKSAKCARKAVLNLISKNTKSAQEFKNIGAAYNLAVKFSKPKTLTGKAYKDYLKQTGKLFDKAQPIASAIHSQNFQTQMIMCL